MWFKNKYHCVFVLTASAYIIPFFKNFISHSYLSGIQESTLMVHFTDEKTKAQRFNLSQIGSLLLNSLTCGAHVCISVSLYVCACPSRSCVEAWVCLGVLQKYWMSKIIQHKQIISQVNKDKEYDKSEKNSSDWENKEIITELRLFGMYLEKDCSSISAEIAQGVAGKYTSIWSTTHWPPFGRCTPFCQNSSSPSWRLWIGWWWWYWWEGAL